jgi:streptomycin 6-kinase
MAALPIPRNLADCARDHPGGLRDWLTELPTSVAGVAERWSLRLGDPYQPGGQCSWVAPATDADGRDLVLKVGWRHPEAEHEAEALRLWDGHGAVRVHAALLADQTCVLLLERCVQGTPLADAMPEPDQDLVVARTLRGLWREPPAGHPFRPLWQMCEEWASNAERQLAGGPPGFDPGLARLGITMFRDLPRAAGRPVLLCTDLHAENILAARRVPWLAIDPKPYVGDPAYDVLQHMLNCDRLDADPAGLARRMAGLLDLDADLVRSWMFARAVVECAGSPRLRQVAVRLAP